MIFTTEPINPVNRIIRVAEGTLQGIAAGNPAYTVFRGVPYAEPPVGANRWKEAKPPKQWEGIRKCDEFQPACIQEVQMAGSFYQKEFYPDTVPMGEDCLYLNIWTPDTTAEKLPVLFFIHGGAFISGFSWEMEFDGEAMCRRNCILITAGYRLGALGFFAHPELTDRSPRKISGNYAVTDCIQALKWVKTNATAFGGDPNNITIFGQSAGGAMVQTLITSPKAKGLFQRAIVQSAGGLKALGTETTLQQMEQMGKEVSEKIGKSLDELLVMEAAELNSTIQKALMDLYGFGLYMNPCIDGFYQLKSTGASFAAGEYPDINIMTGSVGGDGALFDGWPAKTMEEFQGKLHAMYGELAEQYLELYHMKSEEELAEVQKKRAEIISMLNPSSWAAAADKQQRKPFYVYYFNRKMPGDDAGAYHSSELWYIFGTIDRCWRSMAAGFGAGDYTLSRSMADYWCNFARSGDPNGDSVPKWLPFTETEPILQQLNEKQIINRDIREIPMLKEHVKLQHIQYHI